MENPGNYVSKERAACEKPPERLWKEMCQAPQEAGPGGEGANGGVGGVLSSFWSLQVPSQLAHSQLCVCVCSEAPVASDSL